MKQRNYLATAFIAILFLPLLGAKSAETPKAEFDLDTVEYIEVETHTELGFDTSAYLPKNFDPFAQTGGMESINYIQDEMIELGFDTKKYLPEDFDPYQK